jgi:hypothetical protein
MYIIGKRTNDYDEQMNIVCNPSDGQPMKFETAEEAEEFKEKYGFGSGTVMSEGDVDLGDAY